MKVTLVVVCHGSSGVLADCVTGFRRDAAAAGFEPEVVAVEQSEDAAEAGAVAAVGVDRLCVRPNQGYAAGLNAGAAVATGEVLLLANPDIAFGKGSVAALVRTLATGFDLVGPRLVWDAAGQVLLPVAEDPAPASELERTLRRRWQPAWQLGLGRALAESWRVWTAHGAVPVPGLRGPLLALRRSGFDRIGPLDEGYFLYYEDTEWVWRARRRGARPAVAADSTVVHRWGHATDQHPDRERIQEASRRRFFERNYPRGWRALLERCAAGPQRAGIGGVAVTGAEQIPALAADLWLVSTYPHLIPAVGWLGPAPPPAGVLELTARGQWYCLAAARRRGRWRIVGSWSWHRS